MEGAGDADTLSGREGERRQDRSSLHHSSAERKGGRLGHGCVGRKGQREEVREREIRETKRESMGRGENGKKRE